MDDSNDKDKECNPPLPRRCTDHQFDTSSNGMESSSPPFIGTTPPQVKDGHSPLYASASSSSTKKWNDTCTCDESKDSPAYKSDKLFDFSAAGIDRLGIFDDAAAMDTVDELTMGPPDPPLSS